MRGTAGDEAAFAIDQAVTGGQTENGHAVAEATYSMDVAAHAVADILKILSQLKSSSQASNAFALADALKQLEAVGRGVGVLAAAESLTLQEFVTSKARDAAADLAKVAAAAAERPEAFKKAAEEFQKEIVKRQWTRGKAQMDIAHAVLGVVGSIFPPVALLNAGLYLARGFMGHGTWWEAGLIAQRDVSTPVLVHRRQLLEQWIERLSSFLGIPGKSIGRTGGGLKKSTGAPDVAIIQSSSCSAAPFGIAWTRPG